MSMTPHFNDYVAKIRSLPADPTNHDVVTSDFLLKKEGQIEVYYAPLHGVTTTAKIVIIGITPGKKHMLAAFKEARQLLNEGVGQSELFGEIRRRMAFGGPMRSTLIAMLNKIGIAQRLGLSSAGELFSDKAHLLHSTSALRFPVFKNGDNYKGSPLIHRGPFFIGSLSSAR